MVGYDRLYYGFNHFQMQIRWNKNTTDAFKHVPDPFWLFFLELGFRVWGLGFGILAKQRTWPLHSSNIARQRNECLERQYPYKSTRSSLRSHRKRGLAFAKTMFLKKQIEKEKNKNTLNVHRWTSKASVLTIRVSFESSQKCFFFVTRLMRMA